MLERKSNVLALSETKVKDKGERKFWKCGWNITWSIEWTCLKNGCFDSEQVGLEWGSGVLEVSSSVSG